MSYKIKYAVYYPVDDCEPDECSSIWKVKVVEEIDDHLLVLDPKTHNVYATTRSNWDSSVVYYDSFEDAKNSLLNDQRRIIEQLELKLKHMKEINQRTEKLNEDDVKFR